MLAEDWDTITGYMEMLKPLMLATNNFKGYPRQGRNGLVGRWCLAKSFSWITLSA
jgi:hypothetical protein